MRGKSPRPLKRPAVTGAAFAGGPSRTGPNQAKTVRLKQLRQLECAGAGHAERLAAPSSEAIRTFIKSQLCPWCGDGPWKVLALHTHHAHGVSAAELREFAGVTKRAVICSPEASQKATRAARLRGSRATPEELRLAARKPRKLSSAAVVQRADSRRAAVRARLDSLERERQELIQEFERAGADYAAVRKVAASHGIAVKSMADRLRTAGVEVPDGRLEATSRFSDADRKQMIKLYNEGASQSAIGRQFGTKQGYVSIILRSAGISPRPFRRPSRMTSPEVSGA